MEYLPADIENASKVQSYLFIILFKLDRKVTIAPIKNAIDPEDCMHDRQKRTQIGCNSL